MTVAADSRRRNGTKDGPDTEFARRRTGSSSTSRLPVRAVDAARHARWRRTVDAVVVVVVINLDEWTPARIAIDRQGKRYRRCLASDWSTKPLSYTEKKVGFIWQINTCHGTNKYRVKLKGAM